MTRRSPIKSRPPTALVLPDQLERQAAQAVHELLAEAAAANTTRSYRIALRYWGAWHQARFGAPFRLPVSEAVVIQFLVDHLLRKPDKSRVAVFELPPAVDQALVAAGIKARPGPYPLTTVRHRIAVLSTAHQLKQLPNPCEQAAVRALLRGAARAAVKRGERPRKKDALTLEPLEAMLATCDDSIAGVRDRALLGFGFSSGGRRRSEIAAADMRDLRRIGPGRFLYRLAHSKTRKGGHSDGPDQEKPVFDAAGAALEAWLAAARITEGAIFRRLWKSRVGGPLTPMAVRTIVKRRARLAGLEGDFGAHSLRSGFITEASRQGIGLASIMELSDHRTIASVLGYVRAGSVENNPAAHLLKLKGDQKP